MFGGVSCSLAPPSKTNCSNSPSKPLFLNTLKNNKASPKMKPYFTVFRCGLTLSTTYLSHKTLLSC